MKRTRCALILGLAILFALPAGAGAQATNGAGQHRSETTLIVDALPLQAQVLVDGRPIGLAGDLLARAISVLPGRHTLEINAPGFHRYVGHFTADPLGSASQFVVTLVPR